MDILSLVVMGFVQGVTEFLPVSSSGHLVLLARFFDVPDSLFVSIVLHIASLLSIFVVFRKEILYIIKHPLSKESMHIVIATIPTCIIAIILMPLIDSAFGGGSLPFFFLLTAFLLLIGQNLNKKGGGKELDNKSAFLIGVAQGFACFPGLSRSGSTISTGLMCKVKQEECAKFSFLLSIPIILLSMCLEIFKLSQGEVISVNILGLVLGFITAFIVGIFAIKVMLKLTQKVSFKGFCVYLILIALVAAII